MFEVLFSRLKSLAIAVIVFGYGAVALARGGDTAWLGTVLVAMYGTAFYLGRVMHLALRHERDRKHPGREILPNRAPWPDAVLALLASIMYLRHAAATVRQAPLSPSAWTILSFFVLAFVAGFLTTRVLRDRAEAKLAATDESNLPNR